MKKQRKGFLIFICILCLMLFCISCAKETGNQAPAEGENTENQIDVNEVSTADWQYWGSDKKWDDYSDSMGFAYIPDGYQFGAHVQMLDRNVFVLIPTLADDDYGPIEEKFQDHAHRVVVEQHWPNIDTTTLVTWEEIVLGENQEAIQYIYGNGNLITYAELPPYVPNIYDQYLEPVEGDYVIEWSTERFDCRVYGSFVPEEMLKITEGWVGVDY